MAITVLGGTRGFFRKSETLLRAANAPLLVSISSFDEPYRESGLWQNCHRVSQHLGRQRTTISFDAALPLYDSGRPRAWET